MRKSLSLTNSIMSTVTLFDKTKHINDHDRVFWKARELAKVLEYTDYRNFLNVIEKAKIACKKSWYLVSDHFVDANEMVELGLSSQRTIDDVHLSRYACYLIVQNADPAKEIVAKWQTYFAIQTRKQEIQDERKSLSGEDEKRVYLRDEMKVHNKKLAWTAKQAGVTNFADFTDAWYQWLYGWLRQADIHQKKWLEKEQKILDHMNSEELAANLFRATQTEAKIKREEIKWQVKASKAHYEVWKKVRDTIKEIWGNMPEDLPAVEDIAMTRKKLKSKQNGIVHKNNSKKS
jgi:DNA-damage-inducible protein D